MLGVIRFPIAWVAAGALGEPGIWLSFAISNVAGAIIAFDSIDAGRGVRRLSRTLELTSTKSPLRPQQTEIEGRNHLETVHQSKIDA